MKEVFSEVIFAAGLEVVVAMRCCVILFFLAAMMRRAILSMRARSSSDWRAVYSSTNTGNALVPMAAPALAKKSSLPVSLVATLLPAAKMLVVPELNRSLPIDSKSGGGRNAPAAPILTPVLGSTPERRGRSRRCFSPMARPDHLELYNSRMVRSELVGVGGARCPEVFFVAFFVALATLATVGFGDAFFLGSLAARGLQGFLAATAATAGAESSGGGDAGSTSVLWRADNPREVAAAER